MLSPPLPLVQASAGPQRPRRCGRRGCGWPDGVRVVKPSGGSAGKSRQVDHSVDTASQAGAVTPRSRRPAAAHLGSTKSAHPGPRPGGEDGERRGRSSWLRTRDGCAGCVLRPSKAPSTPETCSSDSFPLHVVPSVTHGVRSCEGKGVGPCPLCTPSTRPSGSTTVRSIPNKRDPSSPVRAGLWEVGAARPAGSLLGLTERPHGSGL